MTLWKLYVHFEVGRGFSDYLSVDDSRWLNFRVVRFHFSKVNYSACAMTISRELRGAVHQRGTISLVLKVLIVVILTSNTQGQVVELNKNQGIMIPNQPHQIVNVNNNITITCISIQTAEIIWTLPKWSSEFTVGKETNRRKKLGKKTPFSIEIIF
jgi:hypothetical protein